MTFRNMKYTILCSVLFASCGAYADPGPKNLGNATIGMSKADYIVINGGQTIDCNTFRDKNGKPKRSEFKYLNSEKKTLCWAFSFEKVVTTERIEVGDVTYDVIEAASDSNEFISSIGHSSKAIFLGDRLISLEIYAPKVTLDILVSKYGAPRLIDNRKIEVCTNRLGGEFRNNVGRLDAVWVSGEVASILRIVNSSPENTCTDGLSMMYYILEERKQLELIESAIERHRKDISKEAAKDSKF